MMREKGTSGRRISTWASPLELHAGMAMLYCHSLEMVGLDCVVVWRACADCYCWRRNIFVAPGGLKV
ncbi:hypothetical protein TorRG33x02_052980 [Trema orientale]|uniref:Uncharacterized protein n=1 Tax=Trema orientale TaxID=63057 RepID=A0A2P5FMN1_TREOI|nr:hypothetical protein TorRG33x02_052980 [Trema orientale]